MFRVVGRKAQLRYTSLKAGGGGEGQGEKWGMLGGDCLYSSRWSSLAAGLSLVPHPALPVEQLEFAFSSLSLADPRWNWPTGSASVEMQTLAETSCCYAKVEIRQGFPF